LIYSTSKNLINCIGGAMHGRNEEKEGHNYPGAESLRGPGKYQ